MKPKTLLLIALGGVAGVALCFGIALGLSWLMLEPAAQRPFMVQEPGNPQALAWNQVFRPAPVERPCSKEEAQALRGPVVASDEYRLSGPYTHANLSIYLVHGRDTLLEGKVVTLQDALQRNLAVVHETGLGQLAIDNHGAAPLFIQAGDIVKGGTQDRVLPYDLVVPPQALGHPLPALCVEQGRSGPRGNEISTSFQSATEQLPGHRLKMAAAAQSQEEVWSSVQLLQANLSRSAGGSVRAPQSHTSLQLTLETERVRQSIEAYLEKLLVVTDEKDDAIGFVAAVNGKLQSADVYASSAIFHDLWPKLVKASAVGALAEKVNGVTLKSPPEAAVKAMLANAESGQAFRQQSGENTLRIRQDGQTLVLDTCDASRGNLVLHRSFLVK